MFEIFWDNIDLITKVFYILDIILFLGYILVKYKKRKYLISFFNLNIYISVFTLFIISPFQFEDKAWLVLGNTTSAFFYGDLNECLLINLIGFMFFLFSYSYNEFKGNTKNFIINYSKSIGDNSFDLIFFLSIIIWILLIIQVKTIPLFGNRTIFSEDQYRNLRPIYLAMSSLIGMCSTIYFMMFVEKKKKLFSCILGILILMLTGNRGSLLAILFTGILFFLYKKYSRNKINLRLFSALILILLITLNLSFIRNGTKMDFNNIFNEFLYGNTFSDIRDGAYVLYGWHNTIGNFLMGKNYIADLISFIPSGGNSFRQMWSWGSFSTDTLFGMKDHYGFRGGWFLEPYINFGYIGVVLIALIYGKVLGLIENMFYKQIFILKSSKFYITYFLYSILLMPVSSLLISAGFHDFYVSMFLFITVLIFSKFHKKLSKNIEYRTILSSSNKHSSY